MAETIHVRGEGGMVIAMSLPLGEGIARRLERGHLTRVNADGSPYSSAAPERPAQSAGKDAWVGWAVSQGARPDDAETMTKADLIDRYGKGGA